MTRRFYTLTGPPKSRSRMGLSQFRRLAFPEFRPLAPPETVLFPDSRAACEGMFPRGDKSVCEWNRVPGLCLGHTQPQLLYRDSLRNCVIGISRRESQLYGIVDFWQALSRNRPQPSLRSMRTSLRQSSYGVYAEKSVECLTWVHTALSPVPPDLVYFSVPS